MHERNWQYLTLTRKDRVLTVSFDSKTKVNSLNNALLRELTALAIELQQDCELSAIILKGRSDIFSGGMDLADPELKQADLMSLTQKRQLARLGPAMCNAWEALEPVTIVAIEGWCIGGGMALACACDWRVVSSDASLYVPELKLGMNMSWQSVPRFNSLIGPARTKRLLILTEPLDAQTAEHWGLVDYVVPSGETLKKSLELAAAVAAQPPLPVRMIKRAITDAASTTHYSSSSMDADQFLLTQQSSDAQEGLTAFFEKREAKFTGD
ncbi:MAG: enoyl-CoA hydratase/isomerase family protein [Pseudomonadales bacterium]